MKVILLMSLFYLRHLLSNKIKRDISEEQIVDIIKLLVALLKELPWLRYISYISIASK